MPLNKKVSVTILNTGNRIWNFSDLEGYAKDNVNVTEKKEEICILKERKEPLWKKESMLLTVFHHVVITSSPSELGSFIGDFPVVKNWLPADLRNFFCESGFLKYAVR